MKTVSLEKRKQNREYYLANKVLVAERAKVWAAKNKERRKEISARYRERHRHLNERMTDAEARYRSKSYFGGQRDEIIDQDGRQCRLCGSETRIIVHHRDGDRQHNSPENLVTLCRVCHPKVHNRWGIKEVVPL